MNAFLVLPILFISTHSFRTQKAIIQHDDAPTPFLSLVSQYSCQLDEFFNSKESPFRGRIIHHSSDPEGCGKWQSIEKEESSSNLIGVIDRGTCTFLEKTKYAQQAGIDILLIISNDEALSIMSADPEPIKEYKTENKNDYIIPTLMIPITFKEFLSKQLQINANNEYITISLHSTGIYDFSMFIMIFIATILTMMGAYYSSDVERARYYSDNRKSLRRRQPVQEIDSRMAWSFIIVASSGLLVLYFFVSYIFIIIVFIFCIGAVNGLSTILTHSIDTFAPSLQLKEFYLYYLDFRFTLSDLLGFIPSLILTIIWYINRANDIAWILQNIMCCGLLMVLQRTIRLTNLKIASILLCTAFFYDIFWVFISPLFFESSVMVKVATYQHKDSPTDTLPVVLKFPRIDDIFHSPMILGLGDIALPGLLISYLLRFDYNSKLSFKNGYFLPSVIGYATGMLLTDINLIIMEKGQPALLFLVPCTLGFIAYLSYKRGHLSCLWNGKIASPNQYSSLKSSDLQKD